MTLDEAIKHCEEVAQENEKQYSGCPMKYDGAYANNDRTAGKCAEEHRQLAEWLKELKAYRQATENIKSEIRETFGNSDICEWFEDYDYEENDVSEYQSIGSINDIIAIIDKHISGKRGKQ